MPSGRGPRLAAVVVVIGGVLVGAVAAGAGSDPTGPAGAGAMAVRRTPPPRTFTLAATGDWLSEDNVNKRAAEVAPPGVRYDHEPLLRPLTQIVRAVDLAICHMETPIGAPGARAGYLGTSYTGSSLIAAPYEVARDLARVGFDRCSTASNHAYDLGLDGLRTTLEALDVARLSHVGTARTQSEAALRLVDVQGIRVAHLSYTKHSNVGFPRDAWRLSRASTADPAIAGVRAARAAGAEVVVVSLHVSREMLTGPSTEDRELVGRLTSESRVDLVLIHGPHVVQPFEVVNGTAVYWSLGNFISGMGVPGRGKYSDLRTLDGLMATVRFTERPDRTWRVSPWTVLVCTSPTTRKVWPAVTALSDPVVSATLSSTTRAELLACRDRTLRVFGTALR